MLSHAIRQEWAVLRSLMLLLGEHEWLLPVVVMLGLLSSVLEGVSLTLLIPLLQTLNYNGDTVFGNSDPARWFHAGLNTVPLRFRLVAIVAGILFAVCLKNIVNYANAAAFLSVESRVSHDLRLRLFKRILEMPLAEAESDRSGRLMNVLGTETWRTSQALNILFGAITNISTAAVFIPLLIVLSWRLTVIALICVAIIPLIISLVNGQIVTLGKRTVAAHSDLANRMWSALNGLRVIHSFAREAFEIQQFDDTSRSLRDVSLRLSLISARNAPITEILITAVIGGLALIVHARSVDVSTLAAFLVIIYRLQPRIRDVISARVSLLGLQGSIGAVTELAQERDDCAPSDSEKAAPVFQRAIEFEGVTFCHTNQQLPALQDISFEIKHGSTVAIVGASGAGKSTLLDLLLGFRQPQQGQIKIDSTSMGKLNLVAWRSRIGVVSQDPYIFDETIRFNILYGRPEATEEEVLESASLTYAEGFILALPNGYETIVGDRGARLSGGQRQRLVLARALIRNPDLLILDEATNALDSLTEQAFQQALARFARRRTIIVVAHRLATIERADAILVLDRGRLVEQGKFLDLVDKKGLFARMYEAQNFAQDPNDPNPAISISSR